MSARMGGGGDHLTDCAASYANHMSAFLCPLEWAVVEIGVQILEIHPQRYLFLCPLEWAVVEISRRSTSSARST